MQIHRHAIALCLLLASCATTDDIAAEYDDLNQHIHETIDAAAPMLRSRLIVEGVAIAKRHPGDLPLCLGIPPADVVGGCAETSIEGMRLVAALCDEHAP